MTNRRRKAYDLLDAIFRVLGSCCAQCGHPETDTIKLEFHVIDPSIGDRGCDWHHHVETERRSVYYRHMLVQGNLELLCPACHAKLSSGQLYWREIFATRQPELSL